MAKLYKQLQKALISYEERPIIAITKQRLDEVLFLFCDKRQGIPLWHYILLSIRKRTQLLAQPKGRLIDLAEYGRLVEYYDKQGKIRTASGTLNPPKMIETWIWKQYDQAFVDEDINLIYEQDDIRLCTMQRAIPEQLLGVLLYPNRRLKRVHYIKLNDDFQDSLAQRAGIKNCDRLITMNGVNIENDTYDQFLERFDSQLHLPVEMLVCSPATYAHYKENNMSIHINLPTIQRLKPVYATSRTNSNTDIPTIVADDNRFYVVQWESNNIISIVSQSAIFKSPEFTCVNDICFVEINEQYQKAKILFIGSYEDSENFKTVSIQETCASEGFIDAAIVATNSLVFHGILEQLPNELFLDLFNYLDIEHLYKAFWKLNTRFNSLLKFYENLCLTFDDKTDQLLMKFYAPFLTRLIIDTSNDCDLKQFPNLQTLVVCDGNSKHLEQIQPDIIPNLTHLSFLLGDTFIPSSQLVNDVFSNRFRSLRHANLGQINRPTKSLWSETPSLRFVAVRSYKLLIISFILASCPNLEHLQIHMLNKIRKCDVSFPQPNHPLRQLTLWSDTLELTSTDINIILTHTQNVQYLYLQTITSVSFVYLAVGIINQLNRLSRFDGHVKETMRKETRIGDLTTIHQLHPCFYQVKCRKENDNIRIFAT